VVLMVPAPFSVEIDGLRRACGGERPLGRVAPHVTLVPPVNVREEAVPDALALIREAAAARAKQGHLAVRLGPVADFHPASETLYLEVHSDGGLAELRDIVFQPPLARTLQWPYVPHVTVAEGLDEHRARAAVEALADYTVTVAVDRIHLLEERYQGTGHGRVRRHWVAVADAPFEPVAVVGRGGVELELHRSHVVDPEGVALVGPHEPPPPGAEPKVVTARRRGPGDRAELVGVAHGWQRDGEAELAGLVVVEDQRGQGIGRQLQLAFAAV
jgi:2'-5' RNA ligase